MVTLVALTLAAAPTSAIASPRSPTALPSHATAAVTVSTSNTPAYSGDAGDPDVVESGGAYYAFTTGTPLGNYLQALVDTTGSPQSGWRSYTGQSYGSSALPDPPAWEAVNTQTSPGVFFYDNHWLMFYDAAQAGHAGDTGYNCLSVATAASLSPSDAAFSDSSTGPLLCQANLGGAIDPSPFIDPATGSPWLVWKSNDGGSTQPARIWTEELNSSGTGFYPGSAPTQIFYNNTSAYPWESTVEDPSMQYVGGEFYLLFSGGIYTSSSYAEGYAVCASPTSTCTQTDSNPIISSSGTAAGPGGGSWFEDASGNYWIAYGAWMAGCTSYGCGGARRLFVAPVTFGSTTTAPPNPGNHGYWLVGSDGGIFTFGTAQFHGSTGAMHLQRPVVGIAPTPDRGGYWLVAADGGVFSFGDTTFHGSLPGLGYAPVGSSSRKRLSAPIVGMVPSSDDGGYFMVGADGGVFAFGDARYAGSCPSIGGCSGPAVSVLPDASGNGYWLVTATGHVYAFGDAVNYGQPGPQFVLVTSAVRTPDGKGYWILFSNGVVAPYGDAAKYGDPAGDFGGSNPATAIFTTSDGAGYWVASAKGTVDAYGDAPNLGGMAGTSLKGAIIAASGS
jgi:Glycosyl hydrolases family 43